MPLIARVCLAPDHHHRRPVQQDVVSYLHARVTHEYYMNRPPPTQFECTGTTNTIDYTL
jgi:hypothetical protein